MKIVITGALGHIGSALLRELAAANPEASLVLIDNLLTQRYCSLMDLPGSERFSFIESDIMSLDLDPVLAGTSVLVHLAAITDAANSFNRKNEVEEINYHGARRVAEACTRQGVPMIFISTTSVYGSQDRLVDETCSALVPQSPYAESKLRAENFLTGEAAAQGLHSVVFRFGTICGVSPGMRFHTAVNRFCWQATLGQPITVWRTAQFQKRPYLDLKDGIAAIQHAINRELFTNETYNVVTANHTVQEIIDAICFHQPQIKIELVNNKIMNQLSYEIAAKKLEATGFTFTGSIPSAIAATMKRLSGLRTHSYAQREKVAAVLCGTP